MTVDDVRRDFDRIASLGSDWEPSELYHGVLLAALPPRIGSALEIGCGTGRFTLELARRSERVVAIDLAPEMLRRARERVGLTGQVTWIEGDAMTWSWPRAELDAVVSIATLHHLPAEDVLERMRDALAPGGTLAVLDLLAERGLAARLRDGIAWPVESAARLARTGRPFPSRELRRAWRQHGAGDRYPSLDEVASLARRIVPGARVRRHLLWRYSLLWRKPAAREDDRPGAPASRRD